MNFYQEIKLEARSSWVALRETSKEMPYTASGMAVFFIVSIHMMACDILGATPFSL